MAREVPSYALTGLLGRTEVRVYDAKGINRQRLIEMHNWVTQPDKPGMFTYRLGTSLQEHPLAVYFSFEDANLALEFKMRFA
jgi:hypothetical protein